MRHTFVKQTVSILLFALLALVSCQSPLNQGVGSTSVTGSFQISIPHLALWNQPASARSVGAEAQRALIVADSVTFTVKDSNGAVIDTWSQTITKEQGVLTPPSGHGTYPLGTYTLGLAVFNLTNSDTVPTVTGISQPFTLSADAVTAVSLTCFPKDPQALVLGTSLDNQGLKGLWVLGQGGSVISHGGETWYSFTAASAYTKVTMTPPASSGVLPMFGVFDAAGNRHADSGGDNFVVNVPRSLTFSSTAGATYYLVTANGGTAVGSASILVETYTPANFVTGTVTLPASVTAKHCGVAIDNDTNGGNGVIAQTTGLVTGNSFTYTIPDVPAGTYYVYAVINLGETGAPVNGDYYGYYGYGANPDKTTNSTVAASGTTTFDITTFVYTASPAQTGGHNVGDLSSAFAAWSRAADVPGAVNVSSSPATVTATNYYDKETGYTLNGTMYIDTNFLETGKITYSGGTVTSIVYNNVKTDATSGTVTVTFADTPDPYIFDFATKAVTKAAYTTVLSENFSSNAAGWILPDAKAQTTINIANNKLTLNSNDGEYSRSTAVMSFGAIPNYSSATVVFRAAPDLVLGLYSGLSTDKNLFVDFTGSSVGCGYTSGVNVFRNGAPMGTNADANLVLDPNKWYQATIAYDKTGGSLFYSITEVGGQTPLAYSQVSVPTNFITLGGMYLQTYDYSDAGEGALAEISSVTVMTRQ